MLDNSTLPEEQSTSAVEDLNFWKSHIKQWEQLTLSKAQYCRDHQLSCDRFYYWYQKLRPSQSNPTKKSLIPVKVMRHNDPTSTKQLCTIDTVKGHRIHIHHQSILQDVLKVVL